MYDRLLGPMMAMASAPSSGDVARELGISEQDVELSDEDAARIGGMIDPACKERRELEAEAEQRAMTGAMAAMEPGMRKGMAEACAATFSSAELKDIHAFFATPSGAAFARKSYALASDPRIMAAGMDGLPAMLGPMKAMEMEVKAATARLPARRTYGELSPAQRQEIARIIGLSQGAIRDGMERASTERANGSVEPQD